MHCIVSNLSRIFKMLNLPPLKKFLATTMFTLSMIMRLYWYCYIHNLCQKVLKRLSLRLCRWAWDSENFMKTPLNCSFHTLIWGGLKLYLRGLCPWKSSCVDENDYIFNEPKFLVCGIAYLLHTNFTSSYHSRYTTTALI